MGDAAIIKEVSMCRSGGEKVFRATPIIEVRQGQAGYDELASHFETQSSSQEQCLPGTDVTRLVDLTNQGSELSPEDHDLLVTRNGVHGVEIYFSDKNKTKQPIEFIDDACDADIVVGHFFGDDNVLDIAARILMRDGTVVFRGYEGALISPPDLTSSPQIGDAIDLSTGKITTDTDVREIPALGVSILYGDRRPLLPVKGEPSPELSHKDVREEKPY